MKRRILIIDFMYPLPENIGRRMRTMNFVRFFQKYGCVDILYFSRESKEVEGQGIFNKEYFIQHPSIEGYRENNWYQRIKGRGKRLIENRPWIVTEWPPHTLRDYITVIKKGNYDIIFCRYIRDTYPLFKLPGKLKKRVIIDIDDLFSEKIYGSVSNYGRKYYSMLKVMMQKHFLLSYEKKCSDFGAVLFTSESDLNKTLGKGKKYNAYVIPNIYPEYLSMKSCDGNGFRYRNTFLYLGALDYAPNVEGLKWFINKVFMFTKENIQNARLLVVGRHPTPEVKSICYGDNQIELHSDVPDVGPFYKQCGIVVVPILSGGGTRIKILEAGIAGRPVLSTPMGAYGLDVTHGKDLMLFTDKNTFMESYNKLNDKEVYNYIVKNMNYLVTNYYSPELFNKKMAEAVKSLI